MAQFKLLFPTKNHTLIEAERVGHPPEVHAINFEVSF
jgi:hypothetical protein